MKESAMAAMSYVRTHSRELGLEDDYFQTARHPHPRARRRDPQGRAQRRRDDGHGHLLRWSRARRSAARSR